MSFYFVLLSFIMQERYPLEDCKRGRVILLKIVRVFAMKLSTHHNNNNNSNKKLVIGKSKKET